MLRPFFETNREAAIAFSGGVDSAYLLYQASLYAARFTAYMVKSEFQPAFELEDARRLAGQLGAPLRVLEVRVLDEPAVAENTALRCYHCKKRLMGAILQQAEQDGFSLLLDGTNASDDAGDRPGMRAARELSVRAPLREAGLTKEKIRALSHSAGLFTWDKPAYACLATRVPTGERITAAKLRRVEQGETLLAAMGYRDFRLRLRGGGALLQVTQAQHARAEAELEIIREKLSAEFGALALDAEVRG